MLSARNRAALEQLQRQSDSAVALLPCDLEQPNEYGTIARQAWDIFGHIDSIIFCAGISQRGLALETTWEVYRTIMTINLDAAVELARHTAIRMQARGSGHITVISSLAAYVATPLRSAYCAAKQALHGYFEALRAELSPTIAITVVVPGFIRTDISRNALTAHGDHYGSMDANQLHGMTPVRCARHILRALSRRQAEVRIGLGLKGWVGYWLHKCAPPLLRKLMRLNSAVRKF